MSPISITDRFRASLRTRGLQLTPTRDLVVEVVGTFKKHFDAEELLSELKRRRLQVSRATVYRVLDLLVQAGLLKMVVLSSRVARYEISEGRSHHAHLICTNCNRIIEFKSAQIEAEIQRICREHGLKDYELTIEIVGSCDREGGGHPPASPRRTAASPDGDSHQT